MADSINRIVPAPVTIERAGQSSRDGRKKNPRPGDERRQESPGPDRRGDSESGTNPADAPAKQDKTKGKNLDVSA